jgi:hypothetical protein
LSLILPPFTRFENVRQQLAPQSSALLPRRVRKLAPNLFLLEAQFALPNDQIVVVHPDLLMEILHNYHPG